MTDIFVSIFNTILRNCGLEESGHDTDRKLLEDFRILILYFSSSNFAFPKLYALIETTWKKQ